MFVIAYDQDPLDFDLYEHALDDMKQMWCQTYPNLSPALDSVELMSQWQISNLNFLTLGMTLYDRNIILHSEKRSPQLDRYRQRGLEPVYWWSHAIIARDWYRYAQADPALQHMPRKFGLDFNVYNRAWSYTREYRLKFADLILDHGLAQNCRIAFNPWDEEMHYTQHCFRREEFRPTQDLECLPLNQAQSSHSADYCAADYLECWIDVVLETLFDDPRLHLTEKILRPIACGKPFLLAAPMGSLEYLRSYGFETFGNVIDESYDLEPDPMRRLYALVGLMQYLSALPDSHKQEIGTEMHRIAKRNQAHFFSDTFYQQVINEFKTNFDEARNHCSQHKNGHNWLRYRKWMQRTPSARTMLALDRGLDTRNFIKQTLLQTRLQQIG